MMKNLLHILQNKKNSNHIFKWSNLNIRNKTRSDVSSDLCYFLNVLCQEKFVWWWIFSKFNEIEKDKYFKNFKINHCSDILFRHWKQSVFALWSNDYISHIMKWLKQELKTVRNILMRIIRIIMQNAHQNFFQYAVHVLLEIQSQNYNQNWNLHWSLFLQLWYQTELKNDIKMSSLTIQI